MRQPDLVTRLAEQFRAQHAITRRDLGHLLHGQLLRPWGDNDRATDLCCQLMADMSTLSPVQLFGVIATARATPGPGGEISLESVLGYAGLQGQGLSLEEFVHVRAAAAVICRLGDLLDAEWASVRK